MIRSYSDPFYNVLDSAYICIYISSRYIQIYPLYSDKNGLEVGSRPAFQLHLAALFHIVIQALWPNG